MDEFLQHVREILENLSEENIDEKSSEMLKMITTLPEIRTDAITNIILHSVCQLMPTKPNSTLVSLVKNVCVQSNTNLFQPRTDYFRERLKQNALGLLANISNSIEKQQALDSNRLNSLDKQVDQVDVIRFQCANVRCKRLAHFIGHLFEMNLVSLSNLFDISNTHPLLKDEFLHAKNKGIQKCCDFELEPNMVNILQSDYYQQVKQTEEHLFWVQNTVKKICFQIFIYSFIIDRFQHQKYFSSFSTGKTDS